MKVHQKESVNSAAAKCCYRSLSERMMTRVT